MREVSKLTGLHPRSTAAQRIRKDGFEYIDVNKLGCRQSSTYHTFSSSCLRRLNRRTTSAGTDLACAQKSSIYCDRSCICLHITCKKVLRTVSINLNRLMAMQQENELHGIQAHSGCCFTIVFARKGAKDSFYGISHAHFTLSPLADLPLRPGAMAPEPPDSCTQACMRSASCDWQTG